MPPLLRSQGCGRLAIDPKTLETDDQQSRRMTTRALSQSLLEASVS
jgi:hypothetical protein